MIGAFSAGQMTDSKGDSLDVGDRYGTWSRVGAGLADHG